MDASIVPILVSVFALLISAYGIIERRSATERDLRDRLLKKVDDLHELGVNEDELWWGEDEDEVWDRRAAIKAQRMRMVQQALLLERMIRGRRLTSEEYATLALACERAGDLDQALALWKRATALAAHGSAVAEAASWRSMAGCHSQRGEYPEMRRAIARALEIIPTWHDVGRYEYAMTCADLAEGEWAASDHETPEFRSALSTALDKAELVMSDHSRHRVTRRLAEIQSWPHAT
ncbi:hypothetical protein [Isoptericola sp. b408]|uniref:hypothetical protein n=1 Tax=Isoptericola sp. b408 TaxID=3064653 RepID=UPI0027144025|nr:hypothetical protein [Isoptericola sp. b408]MDO8151252.1 hypothetical protein [Isoptericola sp. b408]